MHLLRTLIEQISYYMSLRLLTSVFVLISGICFAPFSGAYLLQPRIEKTHLIYNHHLPAASTEVKSKILDQYKHWQGVKYQWGGSNMRGIDCSALMQKIFSGALAKRLPRTTAEQIKSGSAVAISSLKPGDLVFFQTKRTVRHVGVYIGKDKFIHASSSHGVTISELHNSYWITRFEAARRVVI